MIPTARKALNQIEVLFIITSSSDGKSTNCGNNDIDRYRVATG